jgi:hypothetical protein
LGQFRREGSLVRQPSTGAPVNVRRLPRVIRSLASTAALLIVAASTPAPARAQAFPKTGNEVIAAMNQRYADSWYRTLTFVQQTTRRTAGDSVVKETWKESMIIPGRLRIDVENVTPPRTYIYNGDSLFVIRGDSVTRLAQRNVLLIMGFDVYRQLPEKTVGSVTALHFPMTPVRGDDWQGREVFVIGAAKGDLHSPQLWIDRDRLLFVRGLEPDPRDSTKTIEYRFDNYTLTPGGWISKTVVMSSGGKQLQKEEYSDIEMDKKLDGKMFVPPK